MDLNSLNLNKQLYRTDTPTSGDSYIPNQLNGGGDTSSSGGSVETNPANLTSGEWLGDVYIVDGFLRSKNYVATVAGWTINADGSVEFDSGYFRGDITGASGTFSGTITATTGNIGGYSIGADYIKDAADSFGLASTVTAGDDIRFWAGDTFANRATADFKVTEAGVVTASNLNMTGGAITGGTLDIGGADATSLHFDINGNLWLGAATYNIATNPFAVSNAGVLRAVSGTIGGWTLGATTLTATTLLLDAGNQKIESTNYVSGIVGSGFHLDSNLLEVGNISARGLIRTAVFQKDVISTVGGNLAVLDGDVLDADMTALDSATMTTKGNTTFAVGDILRIKDGVDDEWMEVAMIGTSTTIDSYYTAAPAWNVYALYNGNYIIASQSFYNAVSTTLSSCKFYLSKLDSPTGNMVAKVYSYTGTPGTNARPTGSALATSDTVDITTIPTYPTATELITFTFSGAEKISLSATTYYCITIEYSGGDSSNYLFVRADTSNPHSGNSGAYYPSSWDVSAGKDLIFYVYGIIPTPNTYSTTRDKASAYTADANPTWKKGATIVNYKQSGDGGVYMTASDTNAPYLSIFDHAGSPWTTINTRLRIGNLNGYLGYATDLYGIAIGETTKYLKYDTTNGLRIAGAITASTIDIGGADTTSFHVDVDGNVWSGAAAYADGVFKVSNAGALVATSATVTGVINATSGKFGTSTNYWSVGATGLTATSASTDVIINYGKTDFTNTQDGFILGYDFSASKGKFFIGNSTDYFNYNGTNTIFRTTLADAITLTSGSNILFEEGGSIKFTQVPWTGPICVATLVTTGTGNIDNGTHSYKVTFVNLDGETSLGDPSNEVTVDGTHKQVDLSDIPVSASNGVVKRKIYRTKAGGTDYYLLTTINNNSATTYTDNVSDANLTGEIANLKRDDTFGKIFINGWKSLSLGSDYSCNVYVGLFSGYDEFAGYSNTGVGGFSLTNNVSGYNNVAIGYNSLLSNTSGYNNVGIGMQALYSNVSGYNNVAIGQWSLRYSTGDGNVALGYNSGYWETGDNKLFIDNAARSSEADGRIKALVYGEFNATALSQQITFNVGTLNILDGGNIATGTTTGLKIGTATSQKLGFYNATPVDQPATVADATDAASVILRCNDIIDRLQELGLIA